MLEGSVFQLSGLWPGVSGLDRASALLCTRAPVMSVKTGEPHCQASPRSLRAGGPAGPRKAPALKLHRAPARRERRHRCPSEQKAHGRLEVDQARAVLDRNVDCVDGVEGGSEERVLRTEDLGSRRDLD